ncbi:MAG TPA: class I SAM-dependent methyltransferase [Fontimonas sp.]
MTAPASTDRVSPTAHATGYLWYRNGLSDAAFVTEKGKRLDRAFRVLTRTTRLLSGISLDAMMLARHKGIDAILCQAIDAGRVTQVIEVAAGLSARGWRMRQRYGERITYIETDLPDMARAKRELLDKAGLLGPRHQVVELDALARRGARSLAAVARTLDPQQGTAIITEGLMNYLDPDAASDFWKRSAKVLRGFPHGTYLADVYLTQDNRNLTMLGFGAILQIFVRGRMHVHFQSEPRAIDRMERAGYPRVTLHRTTDIAETVEHARVRGGALVRILEARTK